MTQYQHNSFCDVNASRRRFFKRSTQAALGYGSLLAAGSLARLATAAEAPKLKIAFIVIPDGFGVDPHGGYNGLWFPTPQEQGATESTDFSLGEMSRHLGVHANKSLFLQQLILSSGTGGHNGWQSILRDSAARNTSIDLLLGSAMAGSNLALKRIYSGPHAGVGAAWNVSYEDGTMLRPEASPYQLFNQVLGNVNTDGGGEVSADKQHVFNPALLRLNALRSELSGAERTKIDSHLAAIEQVSHDLQSQLPLAAQCNPATATVGEGMDINSADFREPVTRAHGDVIAAGLSCGVSRVATWQIGRSADPVVIKSVSTTRNPHDCAHRYGSVAEWRDSRAWYMHQVKYFLDQLSRMPDPDIAGDSVLDHTLVVLTSEMADGAPEHMQDVPVTLIGGASGYLRSGNGTGRYLNLIDQAERSHWKMGKAVDIQRVWSTLAALNGVTLPYEGDTRALSGVFTTV